MSRLQPLKGIRILNTRPLARANALTEKVHAMGGMSIELPTISISPIEPLTPLSSLSSVDFIIFISPTAVECFFATDKTSLPESATIIAIGQATACRLTDLGVHNVLTPDRACSEGALTLDALQSIQGKTVVLIKGEGGRPLLQEALSERGAHIIPISLYKRDKPCYIQSYIDSLWQDDSVDIILITSINAMNNLLAIFPKTSHAWLLNKPWIVYSERIAREAAEHGASHIITCQPQQVVSTLLSFAKEQNNC